MVLASAGLSPRVRHLSQFTFGLSCCTLVLNGVMLGRHVAEQHELGPMQWVAPLLAALTVLIALAGAPRWSVLRSHFMVILVLTGVTVTYAVLTTTGH